jgi:hypothetical protein
MLDIRTERSNGHRRVPAKIQLPDAVEHTVPPLPQDRAWHENTIASWIAWWTDPVSTLWTSSDKQNVLLLAEATDRANQDDEPLSGRMQNELRQMRAELGLTMQARRRLGIVSGKGTRTQTGTRTPGSPLAPDGFYRSRSGEIRELPKTFVSDPDLHGPDDPRRRLGRDAA